MATQDLPRSAAQKRIPSNHCSRTLGCYMVTSPSIGVITFEEMTDATASPHPLGATVAEFERLFLAKHPRYQDILNGTTLESVRLRLMSVVRREDPFAHVWIDHLFPDAFYGMLADAWPPMECFWSDRPSRLDLVPKPEGTAPADARADHWDRLPACIRRVWDFFVIDVNRRVIGPFVHNVFAPEISARLALVERAHQDGVQAAAALRRPLRAQMNVGRLMERSHGYKLKPHVDALAYLVTALYYFPQDGAEAEPFGTTLYRVNDELRLDDIMRRGKTEYFHAADIAVEPAAQIPFVGNTLLAFANTGRSAHGLHIPQEGRGRRAFQSHLSLKNDFDHL